MNPTIKERLREFLKQPQRKNFLIYALGAFFLKGISFFLIPLYTNLLSAAELGHFELLRNFQSVTEILLSLGLLQTIYAEFFEKNHESRSKLLGSFLSVYLVISSGLYILLAGFMFFAAGWAFPGIKFSLVVLVMMTTYLNFFQVILITVLKLTFQAVRVSLLQVILGCSNLILNVALVYFMRKGIDGILFSSFVVTLMCCLYGTWHFRVQVRRFRLTFSWTEARSYLLQSLPYIPNTLVFWIMNSANRWILLHESGINEVGIYSAAARLTAVFESLVMEPFMSVYLPYVLSSFRDGNYSQPLLWRVISFPALFLLMGTGIRFAGGLVIGDAFLDSMDLVIPLSLSYAFNLLAQSASLILIYRKMVNRMLLCVLAGSIASIAFNLIFVPEYGAMGSAFAIAGGNLIWSLVVMASSAQVFSKIRKETSL